MQSGLKITDWLTLHELLTVVAVLIYVATSHAIQQRRHPSAAIAWMLFILLLPYLALPIFLLFGFRKLRRPPSLTPPATHCSDSWAVETIVSLGQPAPAAYHALSVHQDGKEARDALLETIRTAQRSIDLCTFLLRNDTFGNAIIEQLCEKARSGVRVRVLLDGVGNLIAGRPNLTRIVDAGGKLALFVNPFHWPWKGRSNLRNHRKLLIADAGLASGRLWCGGRNLAAEYFDGDGKNPPWRDLSFDLRGPLLEQASAVFEGDWAFADGEPTPAQSPAAQDAPPVTQGAQLVASGPDQADDTLHALLVTAAYRARERIVLATPYFVPESALLMALCLAARRGVSVDLLMPARSNHRMSDIVRGRALRALEQAGARVWLAPDMMHAKLAVVDDVLALAGSANFDSRSLFLNYEVMVAFHEPPDVRRFAAWFEQERPSAQRYVATPPGLIRDVADGMLLWLAFQL